MIITTKHIVFAVRQLKISFQQSILLWLIGGALSYIFSSIFTNHLANHLSDSSTVLESLRAFDFTIVTDWKIQYSELSLFVKLLPLILLMYFIFHSMYQSGVFAQVEEKSGTRETFMDGIRKYSTKYLGLNMVFLVLYILVIATALGLYVKGNLNPFETVRDADWINRFYYHIIPAGFVILLIRNWHQCAKVILWRNDGGLWKTIGTALKISLSQFFSLIIIQLIYMIPILILLLIEMNIQEQIDFSYSYARWALVLMVQLFIIIRITVKLNQYWAISRII